MKLKNVLPRDLRRGRVLYVIRNNEITDYLTITFNSPKQNGFEVFSVKHNCLMWLPYDEADFDILYREVFAL
jgi:hypothetical protein